MTIHFKTLKEWLDWQEGFHPQVIDLGLERVASVFKALIPEGVGKPVITVAGTNGKGSCIALLEAIYQAQGYRVGAYTSPHILKYNERIRIDMQPVSDQQIVEAFARIETCRQGVSLSYFEFSTLAALDIFCRTALDVVLLEVGLGGRLDAVNIVDPDIALVSSIDIDHAEWLGNNREAIGAEKAGIFRLGKPAVVGDPQPPHSLKAVADAKGALWFAIGEDFSIQHNPQTWDWQMGSLSYKDLCLPALKGAHQFNNAATVIAAISQLQTQLPVTQAAINAGLAGVKLKGRFQLIPGRIPVLLDVGHNPQAVRTLYDYVTATFSPKRIHAVFAIMKDKDIQGVINIMAPLIYDWTLAPLNNPRAASSSQLMDIFAHCQVERVAGYFESFPAAISHAEEQATEEDLILVFGSFFLVSAYLSEVDGQSTSSLDIMKVEEQILRSVQDTNTAEMPCQ